MSKAQLIETLRRSLLISTAVVLLIVTGCGCATEQSTGAFALTAVTLPGNSFYQSLIRSEQPGLAYFDTRNRYQDGNTPRGTALLQVGKDGELTCLKTVAARLDGHRPLMLLEDDGIFYKVTRSKPGEDYFSGLDLVAEDGTRIEVLHDRVDNPYNRFGFQRFHYDQTHGLIGLSITDARGIAIWNNTTRTETQTVGDIAFIGKGFLGDIHNQALIKHRGEVMLFSPEQGIYVDAPELQWLSQLVAEWDSERDRIQKFVFSEKLAATKNGEFVRLIDQDGNRFGVKLQDAGKYQLNGRPRSDAEYLKHKLDWLHYKEEGKAASPTIVGSSSLLPLDNERIAILDKSYQRMVIVAPAEME